MILYKDTNTQIYILHHITHIHKYTHKYTNTHIHIYTNTNYNEERSDRWRSHCPAPDSARHRWCSGASGQHYVSWTLCSGATWIVFWRIGVTWCCKLITVKITVLWHNWSSGLTIYVEIKGKVAISYYHCQSRTPKNFKVLDPVSLFAHDDEICGAMQHCRPPRIWLVTECEGWLWLTPTPHAGGRFFQKTLKW